MKYEARLEDGTVVSKSDGVEFTVKEGTDRLGINHISNTLRIWIGRTITEPPCPVLYTV